MSAAAEVRSCRLRRVISDILSSVSGVGAAMRPGLAVALETSGLASIFFDAWTWHGLWCWTAFHPVRCTRPHGNSEAPSEARAITCIHGARSARPRCYEARASASGFTSSHTFDTCQAAHHAAITYISASLPTNVEAAGAQRNQSIVRIPIAAIGAANLHLDGSERRGSLKAQRKDKLEPVCGDAAAARPSCTRLRPLALHRCGWSAAEFLRPRPEIAGGSAANCPRPAAHGGAFVRGAACGAMSAVPPMHLGEGECECAWRESARTQRQMEH